MVHFIAGKLYSRTLTFPSGGITEHTAPANSCQRLPHTLSHDLLPHPHLAGITTPGILWLKSLGIPQGHEQEMGDMIRAHPFHSQDFPVGI